jgi:serine/threonine protein kinase/Tol biopolymer transport system component
MNGDRWRRIEELYHAARLLNDSARRSFLAAATERDEELRHEVESLLVSGASSPGFLDKPVQTADVAALVSDTSSLSGQRIGTYSVHERIGAGGMGDVYRAHDGKLRRDVAFKVLAADLIGDNDQQRQDHLRRFRHEAHALAALNHPNIAAIYGLEETDGVTALVMELVDGSTLADRIMHGAIPVEEALPIAKQIAEALEAAHERGIVHRDLKPANIKLRSDGTVKVLDFGLAKAVGPAASARDVSARAANSAPPVTATGVVVGTPAYMSPEQARGQRVDAQTDIWAFGCVLYEMLTGRAAFGRATLTDTLAAVIESEPDWTALPRGTPGSVARLLRRVLEKNSSRRLHAIADARLDLDEAPEATMARPAVASSMRWRRSLSLAAAAAVTIVLLLGADALRRMRGGESSSTPTPTRLSIATPGQVSAQLSVAVSPEGRRLAYVSTDASGGSRLWVRDLNALAPRALAGTEDAAHPFWAPDGSAIGFVAAGKLKRVDAGGGQVFTLTDNAFRSGASWSSTGVILFVRQGGEFATIAATGGPVSPVLKAPGGNWPSFLPDGRHFIFHAAAANGAGGVYVGSLGSQTTKLALRGDFGAAFAPPDYLISSRGEGLVFAQHFDLVRLELTGEPFPVAEGVWSALGAARVSVSAAGGVLAYINASLANTEPAWFDRSGRPVGTVGEPGPYGGQSPRISPDGANVALTHMSAGGEVSAGGGVWVTRLTDGTTRRLTLELRAGGPIWSSDASRILFQWARGAKESAVSIQDARGSGPAKLVGPIGGLVWDWSPDGQRIVFGRDRPMDLWILPVAGGDAVPFARSPFNKTQAQISPDGRWIVYTSLDTGHDEVYVDSFPIAGNRRQVSVGGGMQPRWRRDSSELFYLAPDQMLMAVPVTSKGGYFEAGRATPLFRTRLQPIGSQITGFSAFYDVTPDGQRFLINGPPADPGPPMTVVLNWTAGLNGRR